MSDLDDDKALQERRRRRIEAAKREKERQQRIRTILKFTLPLAGTFIIGIILFTATRPVASKEKPEEQTDSETNQVEESTQQETMPGLQSGVNAIKEKPEEPQETEITEPILSSTERFQSMLTEETMTLGEDVFSTYAVILDEETGEIMAHREGMTRMNPASMTKILTILVAAEQNPNLDDTVAITRDITDYSFVNDCSVVGYSENEIVSVRELFFGTILPSGADAAAALAIYTAGSMEAFVDLMNAKLEELGLSETTHMTNCVGLYDKEHYSTAYDIALILQAAMENELCREALTAHTYTTASTPEHPEGIPLSNWFLRRIEDKETNGEVLYAKTGYVTQSGSCAASYQLSDNGKGYLCVTGNAHSSWRAIYDHVAMYLMCTGA